MSASETETSPLLLWPGQRRLLEDIAHQKHAVVAAAGYGKTYFGARWLDARVRMNPRSRHFMAVAETGDLLKNIILKMFLDYYESLGWSEGKEFSVGRERSDMQIRYPNGATIFLRSAQTWKKLGTSYTLAAFWVDEASRQPDGIQQELRRRLRCPDARAVQELYTGYGEGLGWYYQEFGSHRVTREGRHSLGTDRLVLHGRTKDNPLLPLAYLKTLEEDYAHDRNAYSIYVLGEFAALLENGAFEFSSANLDETKAEVGAPLFLTWDFNIGQVSWGALQVKGVTAHLVDENPRRCRDTDQACDQFIAQFPPDVWRGNSILTVGDASGFGTHTSSTSCDYDIIKDRLRPLYPRFELHAKRFNPSVAPSIVATNRLFVKRLLYFSKSCSKHIESAQTTRYDGAGKIEKPSGDAWTHPMDDIRYFVEHWSPVKSRDSWSSR